MSSSNCCFLTCIQISQGAGEVVWCSHFFQNFPEFPVVHTIKGFGIVNKAEVDIFLKHSCFYNEPTVRFSRSVMCDSLWPHEPQQARPPFPSPTPRVYPNWCLWVGDAIQPFHPLSSTSPPVLNLSQHRVFSNESALRIRWPKYWEFQLQHQSFQWTPRTELLAVQGTKILLYHHNPKAPILCSSLFMDRLSHLYLLLEKQ